MLITDPERPAADGLVSGALVTQMNADSDLCRVLQVTTFPQQSQVKAEQVPGSSTSTISDNFQQDSSEQRHWDRTSRIL